MWILFLTSKCMFILNIILKVWTIFLLHIFYHNLLKLNDSISIIKKITKTTNYCYFIDVILKSIATTSLLSTIKTELQKAYFLHAPGGQGFFKKKTHQTLQVKSFIFEKTITYERDVFVSFMMDIQSYVMCVGKQCAPTTSSPTFQY